MTINIVYLFLCAFCHSGCLLLFYSFVPLIMFIFFNFELLFCVKVVN